MNIIVVLKIVYYVFQYLKRALKESGYDVESAIKNLHNLHLGYAEGNTGSGVKLAPDSGTGILLFTPA